jgi:hypothetical protein
MVCVLPYSRRFKADSHILCRSHVVPLPCRSAKGLDCVFSIWLTHNGRVWFTHAMSFPCRSLPCQEYAVLKATSQGYGRFTAGERHGMCELASAVQRRHVGDLPAFGTVAEWQGSGRVAAGERHGNGLGTTWERHGNGMVCVNQPLCAQFEETFWWATKWV